VLLFLLPIGNRQAVLVAPAGYDAPFEDKTLKNYRTTIRKTICGMLSLQSGDEKKQKWQQG